MMEQYLRSPLEKYCIDPLLQRSCLQNISPKAITLLALFTGILAAVFVLYEYSYTGCLFLLLSGYFDMFDGCFARALHKASPKGAVLDIMSDRVVELSIILAFFCLDAKRGPVCLAMLGSCFLCVTSFLVVAIFSKNSAKKSFYYSPGLIERAEAFLFFLAMILFPVYMQSLGWLFSALVLLTSCIRLQTFFRHSCIL